MLFYYTTALTRLVYTSVLIYGVSHGKEFCSVKGEIAHSSIQKEDTLSAAAAQQRLRVRGHLLCYLLSLKLGRHLSKHPST